MNLNVLNDVKKLYEGTSFDKAHFENTGEYKCPVCGKISKKEETFWRHFNKQDCYDLKTMIIGTAHESKSFMVYKTVLASTHPKAKPTMKSFRDSKMYKQICRFSISCSLYEIFDPILYIDWLNQIKGITNIGVLFSLGANADVIEEFRISAHVLDLMDSKEFHQKNGDLLEDGEYLIRCLEKAKIGLSYVVDTPALMNIVDNFDEDYKIRFMELADKVIGAGG